MRKLSVPITAMALGALLLGACTGASTGTAPTPGTGTGTGAGTTTTPFAAQTDTTGMGTGSVDLTGTPAVTTDATSAATMDATMVATAEATSAATMAATAEATSAATATTDASGATGVATLAATATSDTTGTAGTTTSTPSAATGQTQNQSFVRLSNLMTMSVTGSDQSMAAGTVDGVIVNRPAVSTSATGSGASAAVSMPVVSYVVVKQSSGTAMNSVLVPWQGFAFNQTGTTGATADQNGVITLTTLSTSVTAQALSGAPAFDQANSASFGSANTYWSSQGMGIPVTGTDASQNTSQIMINQAQLDQLNVTGADNQVYGKVTDFLINAQTGEIAYAILDGGATLNNRSFVVPFNNLNWQGSASDLGSLMANFPNSAFTTAPSVDTATGAVTLPEDWSSQIENFWNSVK